MYHSKFSASVNASAMWKEEEALSKKKRRERYNCRRNFVRLIDVAPWPIYVTRINGFEDIHTRPPPQEAPQVGVEEAKPQDGTPTEVPKPQESTNTEVPKPNEVPKPQESTTTEVPKPQENTPTEVPKPQESTPTEVPKPQDANTTQDGTTTEVLKPQESTTTEVPKPQESTTTEVPKSQESTTTEVPKPQESTTTEVPKPQESTGASDSTATVQTTTQVPLTKENQEAPPGGEPAPAGGEPAPAGGEPAPAGGEPAPAGGEPAPAGVESQTAEEKTQEHDDTSSTTSEEADDGPSYTPNAEINRKLSVWRGDITKLEIDAVVNAANSSLLGGGGIDGAIHRAAGHKLYSECTTLGGASTGEAKITRGYALPAKYVLHTVGPVGEDERKLEACYKNCLALVLKHNIRSVAFCGISTGIYGYPLYEASHVALRTIRNWMENPENLAKVDRIIICTFLAKEEICYDELLPKYFPVVPDPKFVAEYQHQKESYNSSPEESDETEDESDDGDDEQEDNDEEEEQAGEDKADREQADNAPPFLFGKVQLSNDTNDCVVTIPQNGFQSRWKTIYYSLTPVGKFAQVYVKAELKNRKFTVATAGGEKDVHVDWFLHGTQ